MSDENPSGGDRPNGGPSAEGEAYQGPGYPTVEARRGHLKKVALWATGAAAVTTGLFTAGKALVSDSGCSSSGNKGLIDRASSWLLGEDPDPPRLAGAPMPPEPYPAIKGKMKAPDPVPMPPPEPDMRLAGEMVVPEHQPQPIPEPALEPPRIRGDIAVPAHPEPTSLEPLELPKKGCSITAQEGNLRSVYLTGSTAAGDPFTVMVRLDPEDGESYRMVIEKRQEILTALAPLAVKPELAQDKAAWKIVQKLTPDAKVRFAGVVR